MKDTAIVIPARIASSRFPNKMIVDVGGETLIERVFRLCYEKYGKDKVFVATDSKDVQDLIGEENTIRTPSYAKNGTERISYAIVSDKLTDFDYIINVQGDMIDPPLECLERVSDTLKLGSHVVTVYTDMPKSMQNDPNTVKCIRTNNTPHWFARGIVGYGDWHLGIYGYTKSAVAEYKYISESKPEEVESLEQLRWYNKKGVKFTIIHTEEQCAEINTPEDLNKWQLTTQSSEKQ